MAGIQQYVQKEHKERTVSEMARAAGLDSENLRKALKADSTRGLSRYQAEQLAPQFGAKGAVLYIQSQAQAMKARITAGDGKAAALQGLAAALRSLEKKDLEDPEVKELVAELLAEVQAIIAHGTDASGTPTGTPPSKLPGTDASGFNVTTKSRDSFGRRYDEPQGIERDPFGRSTRKT